MNWFRLFIPSWRFFDKLGSVALLKYRIKTINEPFTDWMPVITKPSRSWFNLFYNPNGNIYLAKLGLVDRLVAQTQQNDVETEKTFQILKSVVLSDIQILNKTVLNIEKYQFKIEILSEGKNKAEEYIVSEPMDFK